MEVLALEQVMHPEGKKIPELLSKSQTEIREIQVKG
jgi:hypothetical protein